MPTAKEKHEALVAAHAQKQAANIAAHQAKHEAHQEVHNKALEAKQAKKQAAKDAHEKARQAHLDALAAKRAAKNGTPTNINPSNTLADVHTTPAGGASGDTTGTLTGSGSTLDPGQSIVTSTSSGSSAGSFWSNLTTSEKVLVIVGGIGVIAAIGVYAKIRAITAPIRKIEGIGRRAIKLVS